MDEMDLWSEEGLSLICELLSDSFLEMPPFHRDARR